MTTLITDWYDILGVSRSADTNEVKEAYRRMVKLYHPDVAGDQADQTMISLINEAYREIMNQRKGSSGAQVSAQQYPSRDISNDDRLYYQCEYGLTIYTIDLPHHACVHNDFEVVFMMKTPADYINSFETLTKVIRLKRGMSFPYQESILLGDDPVSGDTALLMFERR